MLWDLVFCLFGLCVCVDVQCVFFIFFVFFENCMVIVFSMQIVVMYMIGVSGFDFIISDMIIGVRLLKIVYVMLYENEMFEKCMMVGKFLIIMNGIVLIVLIMKFVILQQSGSVDVLVVICVNSRQQYVVSLSLLMLSMCFVLIQFVSEFVVMQLVVRYSVVMLFVNSVVVGVRWNCFCSSVGVIRIMMMIVVDSIYVSSIDMIIVWLWLCSIVFSGILVVSVFFVFILVNIGVLCSQWCRYMENSLNMLLSRNGMCYVNVLILVVEQWLLMLVVMSELSRMLVVRFVVSVLYVQLIWCDGMCLDMNIYVFGILLLIVVFCSMWNSSSNIGVRMLIVLQVGSRFISSVGIDIISMFSVNICLWLNRLLKCVMIMLLSGCVRQLVVKMLNVCNWCSQLGMLCGKNSCFIVGVKNMKMMKLQNLRVLLSVVRLRVLQLLCVSVCLVV